MPYPLLLRTMLERARTFFPENSIMTRTTEGRFRYTWGQMYQRTARLAGVLEQLGVCPGDRVGTFAWNNHRHLELYFAAPCSGAVLHTLNIRLFPEQLVYIINHAEDRLLFLDPDLVSLIEPIAGHLKTVRAYVVLGDTVPDTTLSPVYAYEELLRDATDAYRFPEDLDENTPAAMCYTSATTGNPKGVLYSHRTLYLHTVHQCTTDVMQLSERDVILPVVPMFHANVWGLAWSAAFIGASLVLPGPRPDARAIAQLIQEERVSLAAGVPTVWIGVLELLEKERYDLSSLRWILSGGAAVPRSLIEGFDKRVGAPILHGYGMTEAAPLTHIGRLKSALDGLPEAERYRMRAKQGLLVPGLEMRLVDEEGNQLPWDGKAMGELLLRGPWMAAEYYRDERTAEAFRDGWYHTGDVATIDPQGYLEIADRTKDMVKSGGEWISSVDLENELMGHPAVREAAVIAVPHPRWQERPVACVVLKEGHSVEEKVLLEFLAPKVARWWLPDRVVFVEEVPKTGVGKFDKKVLRARFEGLFTGAP